MYRTVDTDFWDDPKFEGKGLVVKSLAFHLWTNPGSHVTGLYRLRFSTVLEQLEISRDQFETAFAFLQEINFCKWDQERRIVWVVNMWKRQPHDTVKIQRLPSHFKTLFESPLVDEFLHKYPEVRASIEAKPERKKRSVSGVCPSSVPRASVSRPDGVRSVSRCVTTGARSKEIVTGENNATSDEAASLPETDLKTDNSRIYNTFINMRRKAINTSAWKPTDTQAVAMRANIKRLLEKYSADDMLRGLKNYFADQSLAKRAWSWKIFMDDPICWIRGSCIDPAEDRPPPPDPDAENRRRIMDEKRARSTQRQSQEATSCNVQQSGNERQTAESPSSITQTSPMERGP